MCHGNPELGDYSFTVIIRGRAKADNEEDADSLIAGSLRDSFGCCLDSLEIDDWEISFDDVLNR